MLVAVVDNYVVASVQTITADQYLPLAQQHQVVIDITNTLPQPQVGWVFDGSNLISNGNVNWKITKLAFRERFQTSELLAFYTAVNTNTLLKIMLDNQAVATFVDLTRTDTRSGVMYLTSIGIITSDRANAILTTQPTAAEVYTG